MAYLDGELALDQAATAAEHLEHCRECQSLAADLQSNSRSLMAWQIEPSDATLTPGIIAALEQRQRKLERTGGLGRWTWRSKWAWGLASACVVVAALVVGSLPRMTAPRARLNSYLETTSPVRQGRVSRAVPHDEFAPTKPMIARTANLTLATKEFDKARAGLEDILKRHQGYIGQLNVSAPIGAPHTLDATLQVPSDQRDAAIGEIKKLGRVESESQTGEEVTQQYVDLEARLSNGRNTEQRLTDLLRQRTGKLSDVLAVELEIDRVRGEIEQMEAEKKTLSNRVAFTALNIKITEDYRAQLRVTPDSMLGRFRNAAVEGYRSMLEGLTNVILFLLSYGPSLLIWAAILFLPARLLWRKRRQLARPTR